MKTPTELVFAIVDAACAYRDADWDKDGTMEIEALDDAVDAWRAHLREVGKLPKDVLACSRMDKR